MNEVHRLHQFFQAFNLLLHWRSMIWQISSLSKYLLGCYIEWTNLIEYQVQFNDGCGHWAVSRFTFTLIFPLDIYQHFLKNSQEFYWRFLHSAQNNVIIEEELYEQVFSWIAVFVLPLNAAVNPILYTLSTQPVKKRLHSTFAALFHPRLGHHHRPSTRSGEIYDFFCNYGKASAKEIQITLFASQESYIKKESTRDMRTRNSKNSLYLGYL